MVHWSVLLSAVLGALGRVAALALSVCVTCRLAVVAFTGLGVRLSRGRWLFNHQGYNPSSRADFYSWLVCQSVLLSAVIGTIGRIAALALSI